MAVAALVLIVRARRRRDRRAARHDGAGAPGPTAVDAARSTRASARRRAPSGAHPFGVDGNGRDVFSRVLYGARVSLEVAFIATLASMLLGVAVGMVAGFYRGWVDGLLSRAHRRRAGVPDPAAGARRRVGLLAGRRLPRRRDQAGAERRHLRHRRRQLDLHRADHPRAGAVAARARVRRGGALAGRLGPAHPLPRHPAQPRRADHRLQHAAHPAEHPARGGAVVPRRRGAAARPRAGGR